MPLRRAAGASNPNPAAAGWEPWQAPGRRRVSAAGTFRLRSAQPFLSNALRDEPIGLEEIGDGLWSIVYYTTLLGRIDERTGQITGV